MSIREFCKRDFVAVGRDDTVFKAAELMRQNHIGDVLVVKKIQDAVLPAGIVTDRDVVIEIVAPGLDPHVITVGDIMLPVIFTIEEDAGMSDAIRLMADKGVRRLPVVRKDGGLTGIITLDDLLLLMASQLCSVAELLAREQQNEADKRR
ncbi:CBS domain-containing protein [Methylotenera sp. G11]|uniref:CBS domain-containing protein n=1 Tax=Methylotenera sp. G11 TaxID=1506585 RepID=UPI00064664B0|nr:CBS domain-containing protein [Methylotenera sp. G11]